MAGLLWMKDNGFDVKNIETFDYEKFITFKEQYLYDFYGKEVGESQISHSDINQEFKYAEEFIKKISNEVRIPTIDDAKRLLEEGYLIICNVNYHVLNNNPGYSGHFVVVKGFDGKKFVLHDPGPPPIENRVVDFETFEKAWAFPDESTKGIMAFKLGKVS
ncbi:MAG: C39 family peptidase [Candidatus Sungbacteria bacterium]|nr:C39 family peptidase [Candidatus Sungbacteria bacterium]